MANNQTVNASEEEARELVESSRETKWKGKSFMRDLFLGSLHMDWIDPFPHTPYSEEFKVFYRKLDAFMRNDVDSVKIDEEGQYPPEVIQGLRNLGVFGMKISKKYGGLGFTQAEYCKAVELLGAYDGSLVALVSAHLSIGIPQPLKLFGTDEQKEKYLTRCAAGAISAFALTEPDVGSDPARLATSAVKNEDGDYILNGKKLWITNGTIAELMVVMARDPETKKISAFIVEADTPGIKIDYRCRFMGLKALENGVILLDNVRVPKENLIGKEGAGLKIALITLNTGRLSLPAASLGGSRRALESSRTFASKRVQWGAPVGKHEAISHKIADMSATIYAMESWCYLATELSMRKGYDIRLEAATAKEWGSTRGWDIIDDAMQIRGGKGYETEASLRGRGEEAFGIERAMRDARINRIFEGSSEIMHLMMARELVDKHLKVAGDFLDTKLPFSQKVKALPRMMFFYAGWYPKLWLGFFTMFKYGKYGKMAKHVRFADRAARRLARNVFHGMVRYQAGLEKKQAFMFRTVDIAMEIGVMCAAISRTHRLQQQGDPNYGAALELTELFCSNARRDVKQHFKSLWANDDAKKYRSGVNALEDKFIWLEHDESGFGVETEESVQYQDQAVDPAAK
jgi:alkylation response protein AidB-like acyl-CoA dehydrogenase